MGLIHGTNLERWQEWARTRNRGRQIKHAVLDTVRRGRGQEEPEGPRLVLRTRSPEGAGASRILLALDSASPTTRSSLLTALPYLQGVVDVLQPAGLEIPETQGPGWSGSSPEGMSPEAATRALAGRGLTATVSLGHYLAAGRVAYDVARGERIPGFVVQHGVLTPFAPPLPPEAILLSWTDADGDFWRSGRRDVTTRTIGSQMLWQARHDMGAEPPQIDDEARPVFLGQLHGAELSRRVSGGAASSFCRLHRGLYRPHPGETDRLSQLTHEVWRRRGIEFAPTDVPLRELTSPVVSVFSTGVLEAAARGIPSWVFAPQAPDWVPELWDRYGMRRYGAPRTTAAPALGDAEPAAQLARILEDLR